MTNWLRGFRGRGVLVFGLIATLVVGGLSWLTVVALRLESERQESRAQEKVSAKLQLALSLMDNRVRPILAREDSRPYHHFSAVYAPPLLFHNDGSPSFPGAMVEPSPLLGAELPDWMLLHFQVSEEGGWSSPHVLSQSMIERFHSAHLGVLLEKVTAERARMLAELQGTLGPTTLVALAEANGAQPMLRDTTLIPGPVLASDKQNPVQPQAPNLSQNPSQNPSQNNTNFGGQFDPGQAMRIATSQRERQEGRSSYQLDDLEQALMNTKDNGESWFMRPRKPMHRNEPIEVVLSPMVPLWWEPTPGMQPLLLFVRVVQISDKRVCQGIVLDWARLQEVLGTEVREQFPEAKLSPSPPGDVAAGLGLMTALPVQLDPGADVLAVPDPGWTPLRVGVVMAWAAALVALLAVGLGGWSLIDLSERRIRFVSAVTHELRTPLTTLRLYLDMMTGGLVREEQQKEEYLKTLQGEAERLHRLVGNVLDFARLENNRPRLARRRVRAADVLEQVRATWEDRCRTAGKELVVETETAPPGEAGCALEVDTDPELMQQILSNLIDNACKYTQGAADGHIWVRSRSEEGRLVVEVEDRGPGVPARECRSIFRPFRRGHSLETTVGGAGLGLALARRWAALLGGGLTLTRCREKPGACFRLELPLAR